MVPLKYHLFEKKIVIAGLVVARGHTFIQQNYGGAPNMA